MSEIADSASSLRVLVVHDPAVRLDDVLLQFKATPWGVFDLVQCDSRRVATDTLAQQSFDAVLLAVEPASDDRLPMWTGLSHATVQAAVVVVGPSFSASRTARMLAAGVQDVVPLEHAVADALPRAVRLAVERHTLARSSRKAFASDLATGLPNHQQLLDHMSQLLALRQRHPALMALIVLRMEGLASVEAVMGAESANVLRRKLAVRLRAAVRSSDVVAALSDDCYGVLLASIVEADHAATVGAKLLTAVRAPYSVAGRDAALAASLGIALYPRDGDDADVLMRRAMGLAASTAAVGRGGVLHRDESDGSGPAQAANDDEELGG